MTIYRLYCENGNAASFWVQHRAWKNVCACVRSINGHRFGPLPGASPTHDGATVELEAYDVLSGRRTALEAVPQAPSDRNYHRIADPPWARSV